MRHAISGENVFGRKVRNPINTRLNPPRLWSVLGSYYTLATGGAKFGQEMKSRRIGLVNVSTTDLQIDLGILIRNDEDNQVRVAFRDRGRTEVWKLVAISRAHITEMRRLD